MKSLSRYFTTLFIAIFIASIAVYKWLRHDVAGNVEIVPYALGSSDPLLPNNSTANRRSNRRIEIFIVPNKMMLEMAKSNKLQ